MGIYLKKSGDLIKLRSLVVVVLLVAKYGLKKGCSVTVSSSKSIWHHTAKTKTIGIEELKRFIQFTHEYIDEKGILAIEISDCSILAAPVLLFLLKRRGFSRCRIWAEPTGLALSAYR
jgi:hypothetical protein